MQKGWGQREGGREGEIKGEDRGEKRGGGGEAGKGERERGGRVISELRLKCSCIIPNKSRKKNKIHTWAKHKNSFSLLKNPTNLIFSLSQFNMSSFPGDAEQTTAPFPGRYNDRASDRQTT